MEEKHYTKSKETGPSPTTIIHYLLDLRSQSLHLPTPQFLQL